MRLLAALILLASATPSSTAAAAPSATLSHPAARRWGRTGHRLIARVVSDQLSSAARREVRALLGSESLAEISTWGDEIRSERPETGNWHYVNIPVIDSVWRPEKDCPDGCVVSALEQQLLILADRGNSRIQRAEALKWVVHLVEDLHMPLHAGDRGDRGGNDLHITWLGKPSNLHRLWDAGLIEASGRDENAWVRLIDREISRRGDLRQIASGTPVDWAMESHDIARDVVYPFLPNSLDVDRSYYNQVHVVLEDRLFRASVRLTALLEHVLAGR